MDRNQVIGWVLIIGIVIGFFVMNQSEVPPADQNANKTEQTDKQESAKPASEIAPTQIQAVDSGDTNQTAAQIEAIEKANAQLVAKYGVFANSVKESGKDILLENNKIKLYVNTKGGYVSKAILKDYRSYEDYNNGKTGELVLFEGKGNHQYFKFGTAQTTVNNTSEFIFEPSKSGLKVTEGEESISFTLKAENGGYIKYTYTLKADEYLVGYDVDFIGLEKTIEPKGDEFLVWEQKPQGKEKSLEIERRVASIFWHSEEDGYDDLSEMSPSDEETAEYRTDWISFKQQFFSSILIVEGEALTYPKMKVSYDENDSTYLKKYLATSPLAYSSSKDNHYNFSWYFGPNDYNTLADIKDGALEIEDQINLGWGIFRVVNQYILYPLFSLLVNNLGVSIGIGIILLTFAIKLLLFPITYKNYLSSAKMRVIKPQIEKLNEENKNADPMKKQQAMMELYKKTGVNPMAGCIPALLQMPILIALYRLFPSAMELRHQGFLWADDLSSVDNFIMLPFEIPFYGNHIGIFTVLMSISMFFYMRFNNQMTPNQGGGGEMQEAIQKNMKVMMNLMPVFMLFMFNNYAAGLSFYYFLANVITIGQTLTIKKFIINEKAILEKIEQHMSKPMQKSRWQRKIEEIQSKQQGKR